jgi:hypothetical protein
MNKKDKKMLTAGLALAAFMVVVGVLVFSYSNETLDVQAQKLGAQENSTYVAPFSGYSIAGLGVAGEVLLGIISTLVIFGVTLGVASILKKRKETNPCR